MSGIIMIIIGYLLGSINTGILVSKFMKLPDPRSGGSGNPGANNMLRIAGKNAALITLVGDALKGFIAVIIARIIGVQGFMLGLVAIAAMIGHIYPLYFKFKGGKGVATAIGGILAINFLVGLIAVIAWIIVLVVFRYASLASIVAIICAPLFAAFVHSGYYVALLIMAAIVIWRHWDNIDRLMKHQEDKVDLKKLVESSCGHSNHDNDHHS